MMKKIIWLCLLLFLLGVFAQPLMAEEEDYSNEPWERAALYLGAFFINSDTDFDLGAGASISIDGEELLDLDEDYTVPRSIFPMAALWRLGNCISDTW